MHPHLTAAEDIHQKKKQLQKIFTQKKKNTAAEDGDVSKRLQNIHIDCR